MMFLITYRCESKYRSVKAETWGYVIHADPAAWLVSTQKYEDGTYFIVNVLPVTPEWAREHAGKLRGM